MTTHLGELQILFLLFMLGIGVKAAIVPLHGWLPKAMVAPAPVSSLLHAVAVVKAGAFGIARIVYDVYGVENAAKLGVLQPLAIAAGVTIIYGSVLALFQDELKKRLAYSTVSQVSYIVLGTAILGPAAAIGGLVHLEHQGLMKITLFFGAGNFAETLGIHRVTEMNGVGRRMPVTAAAFTVAALGMIGVPFLAGAVTKQYLKLGPEQAGDDWAVWVLTASTLLNAAYFLPILWRAWMKSPPANWPHEHTFGKCETQWMLLLPPLLTAALLVWAGLFANTPHSPLVSKTPETYSLLDLSVTSGMGVKPTAALKLKVCNDVVEKMEHGDGPVDAAYKAIAGITRTKSKLLKFEVKGITGGTDALGEVVVTLEEDGRKVRGQGADTDIIVAAAKAYIHALNKLAMRQR